MRGDEALEDGRVVHVRPLCHTRRHPLRATFFITVIFS